MASSKYRSSFLFAASVLLTRSLLAQPDLGAAFERADLGDLQPLKALSRQPLSKEDQALIAARASLARLDEVGAATALDEFAQLHDTNEMRLRLYYSMQGDLAILRSDYAAAAKAGRSWEELPHSKQRPEYAGMHQGTEMMSLLGNAAPERMGTISLTAIPYARDKVGLMRSKISIDGHEQEVVVDTGASFSVLSATAAKRLKLRTSKEISVGSSVQQNVSSQVATASRVVVGGTSFENVVFLVLQDDQLSYPSIDYRIDGILGFPELRRLGRIHVTANDIRIEAPARYDEQSSNLSITGTQSFVKVELNGTCVPLHVDTGANTSALTHLFQKEHPDLLQSLPKESRHVGGAGGIAEANVLNWKNVGVKIGNRRAPAIDLDVDTSEQVLDPQRLGTLGRDVLSGGYSIDFKAMRITLDAGTVEPNAACANK